MKISRIILSLADCIKISYPGSFLRDGVGVGNATIRRFAALGGSHRSNDERDYGRMLKHLHSTIVEPYTLWLDLQTGEDEKTVPTAVPTLPFWQLMAAMWRFDEFQFHTSFGDTSDIEHFWEHVAGQEWVVRHPALQVPAPRHKYIIPLQVHADGAEIYNDCDFFVWSVSSMLTYKNQILDTKFQVLKIRHDSMHDKKVRDDVHAKVALYFAWCFEVCQRGVGPTRGFYDEEFPLDSWASRLRGEALMGQFTACYIAWKGDLKARRECHLFERNYNSALMCDACMATQNFKSVMSDPERRALLYCHLGRAARWRETIIDHDHYVHTARTISPWSCVPGFRHELVLFDWLHIGPLGFLRDWVAAIIIDLLERGDLGPSLIPDECLRILWRDFRRWCNKKKACDHRQGNLTCAI